MKTTTINAQFVADAKAKTERRFRNILANSGQIMESGEVRDLANLYVMGYDGELYKIADLNTNPDKQTERYSVKAQADHGEIIDGEIVPTIEKQFGSCRVWLEEDGLHARMYFADGDTLADHAWAISEDASYSIGMEWYEDGYYGTGKDINEAIGILREISMVLTGNDPRAKTIDQKPTEPQGQGAGEDGTGKQSTNPEEEQVKTDNLTPDESAALKRTLAEELSAVVDKFTTDAPESETEPTAESTDAEEPAGEPVVAEAEAEETAEETKEEETKPQEEDTVAEAEAVNTTDKLNSPVTVIKDKAVAQEAVAAKYDWLHSEAGHKAFADTLKRVGRLGARFDAEWANVASKHMSLDGISGLPNPAPVDQYFVDALENSDGIISRFEFITAKSFRIHVLESDSRALGHKKGDTKANQSVTDTTRDCLVKMVYKRLDLDATELYENPWLIDFRSRELVDQIVRELERAAIIGDGRTAPAGTDPDYRLFDGTRGLYSILADATAASGIGTKLASSVSVAGNLYDGVVAAKGEIKTEGGQYLVCKGSYITALRTAKTANGYLIQPGARIEDILGVERVYTPTWMDGASVDAILVVNRAYKHGGERNIRVRADFDTSTNTDILLDETPRWGSLGEKKSAVAITLTGASE
jgi:hypothetical protein